MCGFCSTVVAAVLFCFFFQAEDGIRDYKVTGVQTCALPISSASTSTSRCCSGSTPTATRPTPTSAASRSSSKAAATPRSEERRVGEEWRTRWTRGHETKDEAKSRNDTASEDQRDT